MNEIPEKTAERLSDEEAKELVRSLLHKEGNWVQWGKGAQMLQKAGYTPQQIFEETGFQASQQNLIIVASQVYESIVKENGSQEVLSYYLGPRSDVLYEFRILNQEQRAQAAQIAQEKRVEAELAKDIAKAIKEFAFFSQLPPGFTNHPGDAVAYQYWKLAKQKKDLQGRSPLIVQGLRFAHSQSAREAIEKLLSDFAGGVPTRKAPLLPLYRLELEEELPRLIPLAGTFPLTKQDIEAVKYITCEEPFRVVEVTEKMRLMPVPGWQAVLKAEDPVGVFLRSEELSEQMGGKSETVLAVIDRQLKTWDVNSYFLLETLEGLQIKWFPEDPNLTILGKLVLVLRPKKIIDENIITQPWQMDD